MMERTKPIQRNAAGRCDRESPGARREPGPRDRSGCTVLADRDHRLTPRLVRGRPSGTLDGSTPWAGKQVAVLTVLSVPMGPTAATPAADTAVEAPERRRSLPSRPWYRSPAFWMDWAPILLLGLAALSAAIILIAGAVG